MNRAAIRESVRNYLARPTLDDATIDIWIDVVTGDLNTALAEHPRMHTRRMYTLPAGESLLPLPVDMLKLRALLSGGVALRQLGPTARPDIPGYIMRGDVAEIVPCLAGDTTFALDYHMTLAADNWVMDDFPQVYLFGAMVEAAYWLKDMESLPALQERYHSAVADLSRQGWHEQVSSGMVVSAI